MILKQRFICFVLLAVSFIVLVPATDLFVSLFAAKALASEGNTAGYSLKELVAGIVSETLRALITCYLYSTTNGRGSSLLHGIKFGLLYSSLIASLYIILGGFYFQLKNPVLFVLADSLILLIQGLVSGIILYYVFRKPIRQAANQD